MQSNKENSCGYVYYYVLLACTAKIHVKRKFLINSNYAVTSNFHARANQKGGRGRATANTLRGKRYINTGRKAKGGKVSE